MNTEKNYDDGIELPSGFSSWEEVCEKGLPIISQKDIQNVLDAIEKCGKEDLPSK